MQYAKFRDWLFDVLFKTTPAEKRLGMFPSINKINYWLDKMVIYFVLFVGLPALFLGSLYVTWLHIKILF
jgi:hypothetical protein